MKNAKHCVAAINLLLLLHLLMVYGPLRRINDQGMYSHCYLSICLCNNTHAQHLVKVIFHEECSFEAFQGQQAS